MSRRALHWLVLCFTTLWFGVLVPVHNRGEITLGGSEAGCASHVAPAANVPHCHAVAAEPSKHGDPRSDPAPGRKAACAVCFFIAGLDAPPPVTLIETRLGFAGTTAAPAPRDLPAAGPILPFHSRAPPAA